MPTASERPAKIACQRPYIGPFTAFGLKARVIRIGGVDQGQAVNVHQARLELELFTVARNVVGALPIDLDGRKSRRHLFDSANKFRQKRCDRFWRWPRIT